MGKIDRLPKAAAAAVLGAALAALGCDGDSSLDTAGSKQRYSVDVAVINAAGTLASLTVDLAASEGSGRFPAAAGTTPCRVVTPGAFGATTLLDSRRVRISVASFLGFETPVELADCVFEGAEGLVPRDFDVTVVDALTPEGDPPLKQPRAGVTAVDPVSSSPAVAAPSD